MKRRSFIKSIIGIASAVTAPSLVLAKPESTIKSVTTIRTGLPPAYFDVTRQLKDSNAMRSNPSLKPNNEDNSSIWMVSWDNKPYIHKEKTPTIEEFRKQLRKDMEESILSMDIM